MIRLDHLSLRRGAKLLLDDVSVVVNVGECVGLVGANGSGKSSLFAMLRGELSPDQGDLSLPSSWRVAHVAQETVASERSARDFVIDGDVRLRTIERALAAHEAVDAASIDDTALAELHASLGDAGGYTAVSRAEALLLGLGFTLEQASQPVRSFSGGWRMRLQLAQALMMPSDLLLLDEPTNHLDLDAIVWLEQWLKRYEGTAVVISHDREFLDAVCDVTLSIEHAKLTRWGGNYSAFEMLRAARLENTQAAYARQQRDIAHLERFVERFRAKATKAKQAQSRVKALERMTRIAPVSEAHAFTFRFREPLAAPDPMLILEDVDCGYRDPKATDAPPRIVVGGVGLRLSPGERIGLLGANGQGKSTVVKTIAGTLEPLAGTIVAGRGLSIGYFAQHQIDMLDLAASPLEQLHRVAARSTAGLPREQELRDYLGSFNFRGEMATAPTEPFSGGEKARLALALIIWSRPNLLLLDEPTNHLDLETREALTLALAQFEGTLLLVSHDRALLRATADRFLLVAAGRCSEFAGDLDDYRAWSLKKAATGDAVPAAPKEVVKPTAIATAGTDATDAGDSRDRRRRDAASRDAASRVRKPIEQRIRRIETQLAAATEKRRLLDEALADPAAYADDRREALRQQLLDQAYVAREIDALEAQWLEQQALLEEAA